MAIPAAILVLFPAKAVMISIRVTITDIAMLALTTRRVLFDSWMRLASAWGSSPGIRTSAASKLTCSPLPTATPISAAASAPESLNPSPAIIVRLSFARSATHEALPSGSTLPRQISGFIPRLSANASTDACSSPLSISTVIPSCCSFSTIS